MKANELRIGNLVQNVYKDTFGISHETLCDFANGYVNLKPIPLTEEWLIKFGFIKEDFMASGCEIYQLGSWRLAKMIQPIKRDSFSLWHENMSPPTLRLSTIKYVHQLQNIYFALTNEELKFNQDA